MGTWLSQTSAREKYAEVAIKQHGNSTHRFETCETEGKKKAKKKVEHETSGQNWLRPTLVLRCITGIVEQLVSWRRYAGWRERHTTPCTRLSRNDGRRVRIRRA